MQYLFRWYLEEEEFLIAQCALPNATVFRSNSPCTVKGHSCQNEENIWLQCSNDEGTFSWILSSIFAFSYFAMISVTLLFGLNDPVPNILKIRTNVLK